MESNELALLLSKLREPFQEDFIELLPRYSGNAPKGQRIKGKCHHPRCGGFHELPAVHLDYVGHASLTARLLDTDPTWNWEPLNFDDNGPKFDRLESGAPIGLWIKLTVCGLTRLGYGSCDGDKHDPEKELIGDALRNAAMRFGAALDLWRKTPGRDRGYVDESGQQPANKNSSAANKTITKILDKIPAAGPQVPVDPDQDGYCKKCGHVYPMASVKLTPSKYQGKPPRFQCKECGSWQDFIMSKAAQFQAVDMKTDHPPEPPSDDDLPF